MFGCFNSLVARLLVSAFLVLGVGIANAQTGGDTRTYAGIGLGWAEGDGEGCDASGAFSGTVNGNPYSGTYETSCDREIGFKVFGGQQFSRHFAAEVGYVSVEGVGSLDIDFTSPVSANSAADLDFSTFYVAAVGRLPVANVLTVTGRVGFHMWESEISDISVTAAGTATSVSCDIPLCKDDGTDLLYGIGAEYDITDNVRLQGNLTRFEADEDEVDMISINVAYMF